MAAAQFAEPPSLESQSLPSLPITVSFVVPGIPPLPNTTKGAHWSRLSKSKKEWTELVRGLAMEAKQKDKLKGLYDHAEIHFHISVGSNRRIDPDGLNWSVTKPSLDGLQGVFISDDDIDSVTLSYSYDRTAPKRFEITLTGQ